MRDNEFTKILGWPGYRVYRHESDEAAKTLRLAKHAGGSARTTHPIADAVTTAGGGNGRRPGDRIVTTAAILATSAMNVDVHVARAKRHAHMPSNKVEVTWRAMPCNCQI
jgi:hypothetical protein